MFSIGQTFCLKPGCYTEYKKAHDELWPDIAKSMSSNNVSMSIFLHGDRLFLHAVAPTESDWEQSRQVAGVDRWHAYMATLMLTDAEGQTIVEELEPAFDFGIFAQPTT